MGLRSGNAIACEAGDAKQAAVFNGGDSGITVVDGETYRIFAGHATVAVGYADVDTTSNIIGIIGARGWMDVKAIGTVIRVGVHDSADTRGTSFDSMVYAVKITNEN